MNLIIIYNAPDDLCCLSSLKLSESPLSGYIEGSRIRHVSTSGDDTSLLKKSFTCFAHLPNEMHSVIMIFTDIYSV